MPKHRGKVIAHRWLSVLYIALASSFLTIIFRSSLQDFGNYILDVLLSVNFSPLVLVIFLMGFCVITIILFIESIYGIVAFKIPDKYTFSYPSFWLSVYIGSAATVFCSSTTSRLLEIILALTTLFVIWHIGWIYGGLQTPFIQKKKKNITPQQDFNLFEWIRSEEPIDNPGDDQFGMAAMAKRMASRLKGENSASNPQKIKNTSIGLYGPFGSGKSTLLRLVEYYLHEKSEDEKRIWTCFISGWGLNASDKQGAAEYILSQVVNEICKHANCYDLKKLPAQYQRAMAGSGNTLLATLANIVSDLTDPLDVLERLHDVLVAMDARLVLFVEDLDRNISENQKAVEAFADVMALLDRMRDSDKFNRFSFVVAISQIQATELQRICLYSETMPSLSYKVAGQIIVNEFRKACIDKTKIKLPEYYFDVSSNSGDKKSVFQMSYNPLLDNTYYEHPTSHVLVAVCNLLRYPRVLKDALRRSYNIWQSMPGEINLDELICMNAIRSSSLEAFNFIAKHKDRLIYGMSDKSVIDDIQKQPLARSISAEWNELNLDSKTKTNISIIIRHILGWNINSEIPSDGKRIKHSQNFGDPDGDYFDAFLYEQLRPEEIGDQQLFQDIRDVKAGVFEPLLMRVASNQRYRSKLLYWQKCIQMDEIRLTPEDIMHLATYFHSNCNRLWKDNGHVVTADCYVASQMAQIIQSPKYKQWIIEEILRCQKVSPEIVDEIFKKWVYPNEIGYRYISPFNDAEQEEILENLPQHFRHAWENMKLRRGA